MSSKVVHVSGFLILFTGSQSLADLIDHWTQRAPFNVNRVRYCGGLFVGVGASGLIVTSSNGFAWTVRESRTTSDLQGVTYGTSIGGGPHFVAVGDGTIVISPDVTNWTQVPLTNWCLLRDVIPGGWDFLAVGGYGDVGANVVYSTPIGIGGPPTNWASAAVGPTATDCWNFFTNANFTSVTRAGGRYVAVGEICTGIWTSSNGRDWVFRHLPRIYLEGVTVGNGRVVAIGLEGPPLYSLDNGLTWTNSLVNTDDPASPDNYRVGTDIVFADGRFVVVGGNGLLTTSNGINWEERSGPSARTISYGRGCFVAGCRDGLYQSDTMAGRLLARRVPDPPDAFQLSLLVDPGRAFRVEASSNLLDWLDVWRSTNNGAASSTQFVDWSVTSSPRRFYRSVTP